MSEDEVDLNKSVTAIRVVSAQEKAINGGPDVFLGESGLDPQELRAVAEALEGHWLKERDEHKLGSFWLAAVHVGWVLHGEHEAAKPQGDDGK